MQLSPALEARRSLAPELRDLLTNIGPLTARLEDRACRRSSSSSNESVPWLTRLTPYLGNLVPVIDYINTYRREIAAFFANSTAATQATSPNITSTKVLHYLRISNPVNPEVLTGYQHRLESNRANPYMVPGAVQRNFFTDCPCSAVTCAQQPAAHHRPDDTR